MTPILLFVAGVVLYAVASRGGGGQRAECIDQWARYLADQERELLTTPDERRWFAAQLAGWGMHASAQCHEEAAGVMASGGEPGSCHAAYVTDLSALRPDQLRIQAEAARREGMDEIADCFDALAS